ncbi:NAD(P)H-binding protein [Saccharomonospora sp. NPDC006951]
MANRILITGGTGRLGSALVPLLLDAGHPVRVLTRRGRERGPAEQVLGDLRTPGGLAGVTTGTDVVIHLATTNGRGDLAATGNLVEEAKRTGTPHLAYVSIVGVEDIPLGYYRTKLECERLVERSGLPWTIVRATQFHELIAAIFDAQCWSPVTMVPSGVRFQPVDVTEVAARLVTIASGAAVGRTPDIGGPEVRDAAGLARDYLRAKGRRGPVRAIPLPGKVMRAYREGHNLAGEAAGRVTFADFLAGAGSGAR